MSPIVKSLGIAMAWLLSAVILSTATAASAVTAGPFITSLSPSSGSQAGGTQVHVYGSNLDSVDSAIFGVDTLAAITHVSNVELIVTTPPATTLGAVNLQLFGQFSGASNIVQFTYTAGPPTISSVDNPTGPLGGGTTITIHGSYLANPTSVMFGANAGTIVSSNYYEVVATSPAGVAPGNVGVTVITAGGSSNAGNFVYQDPSEPIQVSGYFEYGPTIGQGSVGQVIGSMGVEPYSFAVTAGTLIPGLQLNASTGYISGTPTQMGSFSFTVTATDSTPGAPRTGTYTFTGSVDVGAFGESPVPGSAEARVGQAVSYAYALAPSTAPVTFTTGGPLPPGLTLESNGLLHGSPTQEGVWTFNITATDSTTGTGPLVRNYGMTFTATASLVTPVLTDVSPNIGSATGGLSVVLTGSGFLGAVSVRFGGDSAVFTVNNDTQITATSPAHVAGIVDIVVANEDRSSATSASSKFTFVALPVVTGLSPNRVALAGGDTITVTGTGFDGATGVSVDGADVAFTQISGGQVSFTAPAQAAGVSNIVVTTAYGPSSDSYEDNLTYVAAPTVTGPGSGAGPLTGGNSVVITGTNFADATQVLFGTDAAASFIVDSDSQIQAVAPAHAVGGPVAITVVTPYGQGTGGTYRWVSGPTVSGVTPATGRTLGGQSVTITGAGFTGATSVAFGAALASSVTVVNDSTITVLSPANAAGAFDVTVTTPGGTGTLAGAFTYIAGPAITGVSPTSGSTTGGATVVITGTGFTGTTAVAMPVNIVASNISVDSDTQITITTPPRAASTVDIRVTTPYGTSPIVTADRFTYATPPAAPGLASPTANATVPTGTPTFSGTKQGNTVTTYVTVYIDGVAIGSSAANTGTSWSFTPTTPIANGPHTWTARTTSMATGFQSNAATARNLTIAPPPTVTSLSPAFGDYNMVVTITGTNFTGATAVTFGSTPATSFSVDSDTQISASTPVIAPGPVDVRVTTPGGVSPTSAADVFEYIGLVDVTGVSPDTGPEAGGTVVTITGSGFLGVTDVFFSGQQPYTGAPAASFEIISNTEIRAVSPAYTGVTTLFVYSGTTDSSDSSESNFTFVPAIVLVEITTTSLPDAQIAAAYEQTLTATGGSGSYSFAVTSGDLPAGLALVGDKITGTPTAGGPFAVTITATDTSSTPQTDPQAFTLTVLPPEFSASAGADAVSGVVGEALAYGFTYSGGTGQLTYSYTGDLPDGVTFTDGAIAGTPTEAGVFVFTVTGADESTGEGPYGRAQIVTLTVTAAAPTVTSISPVTGPSAGGTVVILTGENFTGATAVSFGATAAASFTIDSATQITATAPAGTGTVDVTVTTTGGTSATSAADQYTYVGAPTVTSVSPTAGPATGGTTVVITGTNFAGSTAVTFGATPATGFTVNSATQITATAPAGTGTVDVRVTTAGGASPTNAGDQFTYVGAPTVTAVSPASGSTTGSTSVVLTGTNFSGATAVTFGATAATGFTVNSATQITATAPAGTGTVDVRVTTVGGTSPTSAADQFTYVAAPAAPSVATPSNGSRTNDDTPTYSGTGANGATITVLVDGGSIGTTTVSGGAWSLTQPTTLSDAAHTVKATATNAGGVSPDSNTNTFTVDTAAPAAPVVTAPVNGAVTSDNTPTFTGTAEANATVRIFIGGSFSGFANLTGTNWTYTPTALADAQYSAWATATDVAGNLSPQSTTQTLTIDTAAPAAPVVIAPADGSSSTDDTPTISGTAEANASIAVIIDGASVGTTSADGSGNWVLTSSALAIGPHTVKAQATDAAGGASPDSSTNTFTVLSPVTLPTANPSTATVGIAYATSFAASGGAGNYSYVVAVGALPAGLALDASTGALSGTPTSGGAFNFQIKAIDTVNAAANATQSYALTVNAATILIAPATLPAGDIGAGYSATISASGGTASYGFAVTAGALPTGLSLDPSSGALSGTSTTVGSFNVTITATDSSTGTGPYTGARAYTIVINQVLPVPGAITTSTAYNTAVGIDVAEASSGFGVPTAATVASGPSHGSISVAGTVITYTPATGYNGPDSFTYATSNTAGTSAATATVSITVGAPTLAVDLSSSDFQVGAAYSGLVTASGGQSPYSYALTGGALPTGLTFNPASGAITGTPTAAGAWSFTIEATDSSSGTAASASQAFSGTVGAAVITLTPAHLGAAQVAEPYSADFSASGGTGPYSYAVSVGVLPPGMTLSANGALTGTPTAGGEFDFTVVATDSSTGTGAPFTGSKAYQLAVRAPTISITPATLADGQTSFAYSQTLTATGGTGPYAFTVTAGALPDGLILSAAGLLSGTPTTGGSFAFTVAATDGSTGAGPYSGSTAYSLSIGQPPAPSVAPVVAAVAYNSAGQAITLVPTGAYTSLSVTQPAHGSVSISGTTVTYIPTAGYYGADSFTYTATGPGGASAPATVSLTVGTPAAPTVAAVAASVDYDSPGQAITLEPAGVFTSLDATQPVHGSVTVTGSTATYTPTTGYVGNDSFTYTATGPGGTSAPATVTVTIAQPEAPAPEPEQPPATVVTGGSTTIDLGDYAEGDITGFRVIDPVDHGQFTIGSPGARVGETSAAAQTFTATYTPAANFMGVDTVTIVAFGPGGDSAPIVISFHVSGTAPNLSANVLANGSVDIHPTASVVGGPFEGVRITSAPAFGTAVVNGLDVRFTPGGPSASPASIGYVIELPFGDSQPGVITIVVAPAPTAQDILATTPAGRPVTVSLTATATGGPFTAAAVTGISPAGAGTATITEAGPAGAHTYSLTFTPADAFTGVADIGFTLSNASGASTPAFVRVTVVARPDPSLDPNVRGLVTAQAGAAQRFADGQTDNFNRRLEQIRDGSNESSFGLRLNAGADELDPQEQQRQQLGVDTTRYDRDWFVAAPEPFTLPTLRAAPAGPPAGRVNADGKPSVIGVWTAGNIDFGRRDVQTGERDNRFTTSALSGGVDYRVSDALVIGGGLGFGEDITKVGDDGTRSEAQTFVGAVYAGFHPNETVFVDGVLGYGDLAFDTRRYDPTAGVFTFGRRSGDMTFGSVTAGLQQETDGGLRWSPYGRVDLLSATLDAFTESGAGTNDLAYEAMDVSSQSGTLGVRAWWEGEVGGLSLQPRTRLEWVYEFNGDATQVLRYADWLGSLRYSFDPEVMSRSTIQLELGLGMDMGDGFVLDFDYRGAFGDSGDTHGFRFGLKGTF